MAYAVVLTSARVSGASVDERKRYMDAMLFRVRVCRGYAVDSTPSLVELRRLQGEFSRKRRDLEEVLDQLSEVARTCASQAFAFQYVAVPASVATCPGKRMCSSHTSFTRSVARFASFNVSALLGILFFRIDFP